jgi:murein L,D-transpeptidase YcbB/YkuD
MRGQAVQWLKTNLAKLDNLDLIVPPDVPYDLDLQFQVLKFQQKYGLKADAVAGPATLIALNSLVSTDHPTLAWRGES